MVAILAFNNQSPEPVYVLRPQGLDATASYTIEGDSVASSTGNGAALMQEGLRVLLDQPERSDIVWLQAVNERPGTP